MVVTTAFSGRAATSPGGTNDRSPGGRPHPRGRRAHLRARRVGPAGRLGRRGHQDRARRAGRRHAGPRLERRRRRSAATSTRCSSTRTAASRASASTSPPTKGSTSSTSSPRPPTSSSPTSSRACARSCGSTSTTSGPPTRTSSTCAGTGQGERGPDADKGSYDCARLLEPVRHRHRRCRLRVRPLVPIPPAPGFGDSIGAMTIAGGIMGALFHRERTGEATTVDVSLLGIGAVGDGPGDGAVAADATSRGRRRPTDALRPQPAVAQLPHQGRPRRSRSPACRRASTGRRCATCIGRPELATDPRFADHASLMANSVDADRDPHRGRSPSGTLDEWRERLADLHRPVGRRAGHARGGGRSADRRQRLRPGLRDRRRASRSSWSPRRCSSTRSRRAPRRAPEFNEHGDAILADLGLDWDTIVDLKVRGVVA